MPFDQNSRHGTRVDDVFLLGCVRLGVVLAYVSLLLYARLGHHLQQLPTDLREADALLERVLNVLRR